MTPAERALIPGVIFQLLLARLQVSFLSSHRYLPADNSSTDVIPINFRSEEINTIETVLNGVAARTPWVSTCLVKVMAAHRLLKKKKISHRICLGVKKTNTAAIEAHAWLSVNKKIIVGGDLASQFTVIREISC